MLGFVDYVDEVDKADNESLSGCALRRDKYVDKMPNITQSES